MNFKQVIKEHLPHNIVDTLYKIKYHQKKLPTAQKYQALLKEQSGIEIGGPSIFFGYVVPTYQIISGLDGVNFSNHTLWEDPVAGDQNYPYFADKKGHQYVAEASDLKCIESDRYDFLLSCHCLEHVSNPLKALTEWRRIVKPRGYLFLVLPNKAYGFDHRRPTTSFEHILEDFKNNVTEQDLTHLDEIMELHDLSKDLEAGDFETFRARSLDNFSNRGLHHHVFDMDLIEKMLEHFNMPVIEQATTPKDLIVLAEIHK